MTRRWTALLLLALLPGCTGAFAWRQKMTVTVETPAGEVSGSSVSAVAAAPIIGANGRVIDAELFGEVEDKRDRAAGVIAVPEQQCPTMVTFADLADPASVELVDPDDRSATFGPGVRLTSVTLEVTREPVTEGRVEAVLGWLVGYREAGWRSNGAKGIACPIASDNLADLLSGSDFKMVRY